MTYGSNPGFSARPETDAPSPATSTPKSEPAHSEPNNSEPAQPEPAVELDRGDLRTLSVSVVSPAVLEIAIRDPEGGYAVAARTRISAIAAMNLAAELLESSRCALKQAVD